MYATSKCQAAALDLVAARLARLQYQVNNANANRRVVLAGKDYDSTSILLACASCGCEEGIGSMVPASKVK